MSNVATESSKKRVLPLVIVVAMAILVGLVMLYSAVANAYTSGNGPVRHGVTVEKQMVDGAEYDGTTEFAFEMILSPAYVDNDAYAIDKGDQSVTKVWGIVYNADGTPADGYYEGTSQAKARGFDLKDHKFTFKLKAGQRIEFKDSFDLGWCYDENGNWEHVARDCRLPFAAPEGMSGTFILNELFGQDSDAAQAGYEFVEIKTGDGNRNPALDEQALTTGASLQTTPSVTNTVYDSYGNWDSSTAEFPTKVTVFNTKVTPPAYKALAVQKQLVEGATPDDTLFNFELLLSPQQLGTSDAIPNTTVEGTVTHADGTTSATKCDVIDHVVKFQIKAGERIAFGKMPFSAADGVGTYVIKEVSYQSPSTAEGEDPKVAYSFAGIDCPGKELVTDSSAMGEAIGTLLVDGVTTITITNKQEETPDEPEVPTQKTGAISVTKALENAVPDATRFQFEMVISPEWKSTAYALGTADEPLTIKGVKRSKASAASAEEVEYTVSNNTVSFELRADETISFASVPYLSVNDEPGTFVLNELSVSAGDYSFKRYATAGGIDLGLDAAKIDKDQTTDRKAIYEQIAKDANGESTGMYGQFLPQQDELDASSGVTIVNAKNDDDSKSLSITKNLSGYDFDKYGEASVAFNVYKFETEDECKAFMRSGDTSSALWKGSLAVRFTANGTRVTELTGLSEGYYAVEEISATNMRAVGVSRQYVHLDANQEYKVTFDNSFDDQGIYEKSIVNSYKKVTDNDGNVTWQRYQDGVPVND